MADPKDTKSIRAEVAALEIPDLSERATGWNAALREVIAIVDRHDRDRLKLSATAIAKRKTEGKRIGGDIPYGFELAADGETLRESPREQRVIAAARKLRVAGHSLRAIGRQLEERGMLPRKSDGDEPAHFHASQIARMIDDK